KNPIADERTKLQWDDAFKFDGQVRNAPARVQPMRSGDRTRRTRGDATLARSTTIWDRFVRWHFQRRQDFREKKPRSEMLIDEHGALAVPPDACLCGMIAFQNRTGIDVTLLPSSKAAKKCVDLRQPIGDYIVIILAPRIPRNSTRSGSRGIGILP